MVVVQDGQAVNANGRSRSRPEGGRASWGEGVKIKQKTKRYSSIYRPHQRR